MTDRRLAAIRERHEYDAGIAFHFHPTMLRVLEEAHDDRGVLLAELHRLRAALRQRNYPERGDLAQNANEALPNVHAQGWGWK